ncbi:hypothetical protein GC093_26245 [Paenibacillus sp. LMG 31456]|uniref:LURP-one-related family protein n=1 Tax=Paenibacillus foliorum TaxID=2654974 RepID=A0A972GYV0_9BACL|nr:hypothetical protein [Paenibacillus foliorum]NOU96693.1 hypothetical protein [Paenibacillus foliorum]
METQTVYFSDRFFSTGLTDIRDEDNNKIGELDLQSMFSSGIHVLDERGRMTYSGKFRFFSNTWLVLNRDGDEIGALKAKMAFFKKQYAYVGRHDEFRIEAPAFSKEYTVTTVRGDIVAEFARTDGMFSSGAFALKNRSSLPMEELILVVMGVHAIQKRQSAAAST